MKLSLLLYAILVAVIPAVAIAQKPPCSTSEECEKLRKSLEEQLLAVNKQIQVSAPITWKLIEVDGVKVELSSVIGNYSNCITEKENGRPKRDRENVPVCKKDKEGNLLNATRNGTDVYLRAWLANDTIEKSDATEACKAIGGTLPTAKFFRDASSGDLKIPDHLRNGSLWSSTMYLHNNNYAFGYDGSDVDETDRQFYRFYVRCIKKSGSSAAASW